MKRGDFVTGNLTGSFKITNIYLFIYLLFPTARGSIDSDNRVNFLCNLEKLINAPFLTLCNINYNCDTLHIQLYV